MQKLPLRMELRKGKIKKPFGGIHKLCKQDFANFWPPLRKQVYYISLCSSISIWLTPLPPSLAYVVYGSPLMVLWLTTADWTESNRFREFLQHFYLNSKIDWSITLKPKTETNVWFKASCAEIFLACQCLLSPVIPEIKLFIANWEYWNLSWF